MEWRKKISSEKRPPRNGLLALSPLLVMAVLFVALGLLYGDFGRVPLLMVFVLTAIYALLTLRGLPLESRITVFSRGAGESDLLLMLCRNEGEVVDKHKILSTLWKEDNAFTARSLGVYINHLRGHLRPIGYEIIAVRYKGYKLVTDVTV